MRAYVALVRSNTTGYDEPIVCAFSEETCKMELRVFCEFNKENTNEWDLDSARVDPVKFSDGK